MQSRVSPVRFGRAAGPAQSGSSPVPKRTTPQKSGRLWDRLSWPLSIALFAVPMALVLLTFALPRLWASREIDIRVTDRFTGATIPGARVVIGETAMTSGPDGLVTVELPTDSSPASIEAPGYQAITTTLSPGASRDWQVALRPTVLRGRLADAETSAGI